MSADEKPEDAEVAALERLARQIAERLEAALPENVGFFLWLSPFGPGPATYVSNGERVSMIEALEELLEQMKLEDN